MALTDLAGIFKVFGGGEPSVAEQKALGQEALMMVLSRATSADSNVKNVEVEAVQAVLKTHTGQDVSAADIRVAAASEIFESAPLRKHVAKLKNKLSIRARQEIATALLEIIHSDDLVSSREMEYFDGIAKALGLTPSQLVGLDEVGSAETVALRAVNQ